MAYEYHATCDGCGKKIVTISISLPLGWSELERSPEIDEPTVYCPTCTDTMLNSVTRDTVQ